MDSICISENMGVKFSRVEKFEISPASCEARLAIFFFEGTNRTEAANADAEKRDRTIPYRKARGRRFKFSPEKSGAGRVGSYSPQRSADPSTPQPM
jgi:hypothetical protein